MTQKERERPIKFRLIATGFEGGGSNLPTGVAQHPDLLLAISAPFYPQFHLSALRHGFSSDVRTAHDRQQTQHGTANAGRPSLLI